MCGKLARLHPSTEGSLASPNGVTGLAFVQSGLRDVVAQVASRLLTFDLLVGQTNVSVIFDQRPVERVFVGLLQVNDKRITHGVYDSATRVNFNGSVVE